MFLTLLTASSLSLMAMPELSPAFLRRYMPRSWEGATLTFFINDAGKILTCEVLNTNISEQRKGEICARTIGRNAGKSAIGPDGQPTHGFITGFAGPMSSADSQSKYVPVDKPVATLSVSWLPDGNKRQRVYMLAHFSESGNLLKCQPFQKENDQLFEIACQYAAALQHPIMAGSEGKAVRYLNSISVEFELDRTAQ